MKKPVIPSDEVERQKAVDACELLDTLSKEERFDRITRITRRLFRAPMSILTVVDRDRTVYKSNQVYDSGEHVSTGVGSRDLSFCAHAILSDEPLIVSDATKDERFFDNPHVVEGIKVRFYVGQPIHTPDGHRIGTLCIVDHKPRTATPEELSSLKDMSNIVEDEIKRNFTNKSVTIIDAINENIKAKAMHSSLKSSISNLRKIVEDRNRNKATKKSKDSKKS